MIIGGGDSSGLNEGSSSRASGSGALFLAFPVHGKGVPVHKISLLLDARKKECLV